MASQKREVGYTVVLEPGDQILADLARGVLESAGIPVLVQSYQVPWYNGIMTAGAGAWGRLLVPSPLAESARELLEAYFSGERSAESELPRNREE